MNMRSSRSTVTFCNPFTLTGCPGQLPAGEYEVHVEEELLQGLSFEAWRRTATYLTVPHKGVHGSRTAWRSISDIDLKAALSRDRTMMPNDRVGEAGLRPQEDAT
jgi:hypothetical protein